MESSLRGKAVVIIGASSGIGRAAALEFARNGCKLVLAARRAEVIKELAWECLQQGAQTAVAVPADSTQPNTLETVVKKCLETFGMIDIWINNAGTGVVGHFDEVPLELHKQVIDVNLTGYMNGTHAVLPVFKKQGSGILINTISVGAWAPEPYTVAYSASKYGLRGFSEALRCELIHWPGIKVCDIYPSYTDTPGFQHAANYMGRKIKPAPPVISPERVAEAMADVARKPVDTTPVGSTALIIRMANALAPALVRQSITRMMDNYFNRAERTPLTNGHIFSSGPDGVSTSGGWKEEGGKKKHLRRNMLLAVLAGAVLVYGLQKG